ncbi:MAG: tetratricopeptide repeat protein [Acidocella sp.]|nr:tetratricopeptide repeat protein [Acidocella sp.]
MNRKTRRAERQHSKHSGLGQVEREQRLFRVATQYHQSNNIAEAVEFYKQVLAINPTHDASLFGLGLISGKMGKIDTAIRMFEMAVAVNSGEASYHQSLGNAYFQQKIFDKAEVCYRNAVSLKPEAADAWNNLGGTLEALGRLDDAVACYRKALFVQPIYYQALNNLGNIIAQRLLHALAEPEQWDEVIDLYRRAIELNPSFVEAYSNIGIALREVGRYDDALDYYRRAIQLVPAFAEAHSNCGNIHSDTGEWNQAIECYDTALAINPDYSEAHNNRGVVLAMHRKFAEAASSFQKAIFLKQNYAEAHDNLAGVLLAKGDFSAGWQEYEWRWQTPSMLPAKRNFAQPAWQGEAAEGQTLLIYAEQGLGDTLQFCRYAQLAAMRGFRVVMQVQRPLVRLLHSVPGVDKIISQEEDVPAFDKHIALMSLPRVVGTALETIPSMVSYIEADETAVAIWRERLSCVAPDESRIGLVWAGNAHKNSAPLRAIDRRRSISPDELLLPLLSVKDLQFVSLQKIGPAAPKNFPMIDLMDEVSDFADTAALIKNLDLVISVDTAVAHLAAALGKPVWLLNRFDSCWRWLNGRRDSPWYPTLRLYTQLEPGNWEPVIAEIVHDLQLRKFKNPDILQ